MEIQLDKAYPRVPPMVSADVLYIFNLEWSMNSRLKNLVQQFKEEFSLFIPHLEKLQGFWSTLDEIDRSLWVVDPKQASRAISFRQIHIVEPLLSSYVLAPLLLVMSLDLKIEVRLITLVRIIVAVRLSTACALWTGCVLSQRQGSPFNVLFGHCPYCSEPVAVKINSTKN
ncbi:hypothetical protein REPUB_Repub09cG0146300 [Reevesia pubescens]